MVGFIFSFLIRSLDEDTKHFIKLWETLEGIMIQKVWTGGIKSGNKNIKNE